MSDSRLQAIHQQLKLGGRQKKSFPEDLLDHRLFIPPDQEAPKEAEKWQAELTVRLRALESVQASFAGRSFPLSKVESLEWKLEQRFQGYAENQGSGQVSAPDSCPSKCRDPQGGHDHRGTHGWSRARGPTCRLMITFFKLALGRGSCGTDSGPRSGQHRMAYRARSDWRNEDEKQLRYSRKPITSGGALEKQPSKTLSDETVSVIKRKTPT